MLWGVIICLNDLIILHFTSIDSLSLFDIVVLFHLTVEALNFVLLHREGVTCLGWDVLHETNHGRGAFRVKFIIISSFHSSEFAYSV
jgi:hypothetical protein